MRLIVITGTDFVPHEARFIRRMLAEGIERVHLRKPGACRQDICRLLESLPCELYPRLSLHDELPLAEHYGLGGVHLNARNPQPPCGFRGRISRSCHTRDELAACRHKTDYRFLSPIFDSISKQGYRAAFSAQDLRAAQDEIDTDTFALGGVLPQRLPLLKEYGFGGAVLLGYIWQDSDLDKLSQRLELLRKYAL